VQRRNAQGAVNTKLAKKPLEKPGNNALVVDVLVKVGNPVFANSASLTRFTNSFLIIYLSRHKVKVK